MRIHKLLATVLAAGFLFSGCLQDEDYVLPNLVVGEEFLDFSDDTELKINLTATRDWQVRSKPDWVAVDPDHGTASAKAQRVVVSVLPNSDYNRTGEVLFSIGLVKVAVAVKQPGAKGEKPRGSGTLEDPYTVGGAVEFVSGLAADTPTTDNIYIKGRISQVTEEYSAQYGNGTFYVADDEGTSFYVYRAMYLGNKKWTASDTQIKVGDEVVICGQVVNFKGNTPETVANKGFIYSLNGKVVEPGGSGGGGTGTPSGTGTQADPYNAAGANAYIATLAADIESEKDIFVKGKICEIANNGNYAASGTYGNASFYISDDGTTSGAKFNVFRALYLGNVKYTSGTDIKVGDDVVVCGKVVNYKGNTPETSAGKAYLYSLNGQTGDGGGGSGTTPGTTPGTTTGQTILSQAFKTAGQGDFTIDNKTLGGLTAIWTYDSKYGMKATGYDGTNKKDLDTESWLISPVIDLVSANNPVLTFRHAMNFYASVDKAKEEATAWVKAEGGAWTQLIIPAYPAMDWKFVDSGEIALTSYVGKKVQIALKYVSTSTKAGTWEVDDFVVKEK